MAEYRLPVSVESWQREYRLPVSDERWQMKYRLPVSDELWQSTDYRFVMNVGKSTDHRFVTINLEEQKSSFGPRVGLRTKPGPLLIAFGDL